MLSPKNKRYFLQIVPFGLVLAMLSVVYLALEKGILGNSTTYPSTGNPYVPNLFLGVFLTFTVGIIVGCFEVLFLNKRFQKSSFFKKIIKKTIIYFLIIVFFTSLLSLVGHSVELKISIFSPEVWHYLFLFFTNFGFWSIVLYISLGIIFCLFYIEMSDNIGQKVLFNFLTGKYHQPLVEERIFMFIDMKSSTTIAEDLGHVEYFKMLKEYYADLSDPIIDHGGEIYKYVGDEVIVTWKYKKDDLNNDCLNCFKAMKESLASQSEKYKRRYKVVPTFKAGIHLGKVTSGEIGVIKKEITFSGDVLNTTARIQGLCNQYEVDLLVSEKLLNTLEIKDGLNKKYLGEVELRGKHKKVSLYTVSN